MIFRLARKSDLTQLHKICLDVVNNMHKNGISLWNEWYPYEEFENDISKKQLYIFEDNGIIISFFALLDAVDEDSSIKWKDNAAKAKYLSRVGVNVKFLRQGIAKKVIEQAKIISEQEGASFLRLMVADFNKPAISLYEKTGFKQAKGKNCEIIKNNLKLYEIPFEIEL